MKKQIELFFIALMFYTRLPIWFPVEHTDDKLNKATRYFPLVGWIVGGISFMVYYASMQLFPVQIAVLLSMLAGILTTGAFHEDGLADFFDGFGGGWTKERILEIMKDSRVGTYGMVATIVQLALKYSAILALFEWVGSTNWLYVSLLFICYHSLARWCAIQLCFLLDYVREDELSKAKPIAKKQTLKEVIGVYIWGLLPLIALMSFNWMYILVFLPLLPLLFYFKGYLKKWLGGYTGDCLGACEQIAEVVVLLAMLGLWKFM